MVCHFLWKHRLKIPEKIWKPEMVIRGEVIV